MKEKETFKSGSSKVRNVILAVAAAIAVLAIVLYPNNRLTGERLYPLHTAGDRVQEQADSVHPEPLNANTATEDAEAAAEKDSFDVGVSAFHDGQLDAALAAFRQCGEDGAAETNAAVLELLKDKKYYDAAVLADSAVNEGTTNFPREDWVRFFKTVIGDKSGTLSVFLEQSAALSLLNVREYNAETFGRGVLASFKKLQLKNMAGGIPSQSVRSFCLISDMAALRASCGTNPDGKILIVVQVHGYPAGNEGHGVPTGLMERLPTERFPREPGEVAYIVQLSYNYEQTGSYICGTAALRENARVQVIRASDGYVPYDSYTVYGPEAPLSLSYSGTAPKWHSAGVPDMGEELCKALEWVINNG